MSILKSIMHHWNKTTNSYDTLHPETESAQITDWHSGIMASLASTTLGTVVSAVTTDSVLGKLIKLLLDASGVKYLIDTNGYVCFGSLFGGLIIQWGYASNLAEGILVSFPVSFSSAAYAISGNDLGGNGPTEQVISFANLTNTGFNLYGTRISLESANVWGRWIAVGK